MQSLRTLLRSRLEWIEETLMQQAEKNGYGYISPATARLYSYLSSTPVTMSALARQLKVSRQAVHQLVSEGVTAGFLELCNDPQDKRVKLVKFSEQGQQMSRVALNELHKIEQQLIEHLGEAQVDQLRKVLEMPWPND
jgi:DNA-binding MarR family transcriptional regulator